DWSSDVCSSDLDVELRAHVAAAEKQHIADAEALEIERARAGAERARLDAAVRELRAEAELLRDAGAASDADHANELAAARSQIARQAVEIEGLGSTLAAMAAARQAERAEID